MEILNRIAAGKMQAGDLERLQDVGWTMTDASLCGLGQTAASAVLSAVKLWPELFKDEGGRMKDEVLMGNKKKNEMRKTQNVKSKAKKAKANTQDAKRKVQKVKAKTVAKKKSSRKTASRR